MFRLQEEKQKTVGCFITSCSPSICGISIPSEYEVSFTFSGYSSSDAGLDITLEVLGEAGEREIMRDTILSDDFDEKGRCLKTLTYETQDTPKVSFAISIPESIIITVDAVSWQRIR